MRNTTNVRKVSAAIVVAVILMVIVIIFVTRPPKSDSPPQGTVDTHVADGERASSEDETSLADPVSEATTDADGSIPVAEEPADDAPALAGTNVLRVILEGITEEEARLATVTLTAVDQRIPRAAKIQESWPCQGSKSEFDLDPFFVSLAEWDGDPGDGLAVALDHPLHFTQRTRIELDPSGPKREVEPKDGRTVYEVRLRWVRPVYWPEFTLSVRDARTGAHLEDVELRSRTTNWMGLSHYPTGSFYISLGGGLSSPIVLLAGREAQEPKPWVAGLALRPAADESPRPATLPLNGRVRPERGIYMYARAPGYAWGKIALDVSAGGERELLLGPATALDVSLTNVQLERYAEHEKGASLNVIRKNSRPGEGWVWSQRLDETLETEGLRLESLEPGEFAISVKVGDVFGNEERLVLAHEELFLAAGETRELVLSLADPPLAPAPPERATLGGLISFPAFDREEDVLLRLYPAHGQLGRAVPVKLADMEPVPGLLRTWSFHLEDLPIGLYQLQLSPFQKSLMVELPTGGREDVELVIPELAEVLVETVDARTGERVPIEEIRYRPREKIPGQVRHDWVEAVLDGEPGRFRFWTTPGAGRLGTFQSTLGIDYAWRGQDVELVPGLQSVRFEFTPVTAIRFEFRDGDVALPHEHRLYKAVFGGIVFRAVDHEGTAAPHYKGIVRVDGPGLYEIDFENVRTEHFRPIPSRRVEVREGETTEVIVELQRKR